MHPYIGLKGRHKLCETNKHVAGWVGTIVFVGGVSAQDGTACTTVILLTDAGEHIELSIEFLILDDPGEARRRLTEPR